MKPLYCVIGTLVLQIPSVSAATIQKAAGSTDPLNTSAAWTGGSVPGSGDVALFTTPNVSQDASTTYATGGNLDLGQLTLNIQPAVNNVTVTINNNTLNLYGVNGIGLNNLSFQPPGTGNKDATFQINSNVNVVNSQIWQTVTRGLNVTGVVSGGAGVSVTKIGGGTVNIGNGASANINTLAGSFIVGGTNSTTFNTRFSSLANLTAAGGTTVLNQNQSYTGYTGIDQINNTATLTLASGNLTLNGKLNTAVSQTFAGTSLRDGASVITLANQAAAGTNSVGLNLGAITRTAGGTFNFVSTGTGTTELATSTGTASSLLKTAGGTAYATVGSSVTTDWAAKNALNTNIQAFTGYTTVSGATLDATSNGLDVNLTPTSNVAVTGSVALGTLRLADSAANRTLTIGAGNTLSTGGILSAASAAGAYTINGGFLTALAGTQDLVVINNAAGQLNIGSVISDNAGGAVSFTTGGSGTVNITGPSTYTGDTYIGSGILRMAGNTSGNANSTYHVGSTAIFNVNNQNTVSIGGITGYGTTTLGNGSLNVGGNNSSTTYDGNINGNAPSALTKSGTGTLRLTAYNATNINNYVGAVSVTGGTLLVNGSLANASGVAVASGATLGGLGSVSAINVAAGGRLSPGDGGAGTLSAASLTLNTSTRLAFDLGAPNSASDLISLAGALTDGTGTADAYLFDFAGGTAGQTYTLVTFGSTNFANASQFGIGTPGYTGVFALNGNNLQFTLGAVPEPSALALLGVGMVGLAARRKRKDS